MDNRDNPTELQPLPDDLSRIDAVCDRFEAELRAGKDPRIEDFLGDAPEPGRSALLRALRDVEAEYQGHPGKPRVAEASDQTGAWARPESDRVQATRETVGQAPAGAPGEASAPPAWIGKYRIEKVLGQGGFGTVYQGFDPVLKRPVAIKVPHRHPPTGMAKTSTRTRRWTIQTARRRARAACSGAVAARTTPDYCRSAGRYNLGTAFRNPGLGFRVAQVADE